MKVGIYVISVLRPGSGGQFTYFEQLVHTVDSYAFDKKLEICFVGRIPKRKFNVHKEYVRIGPLWFYLPFWLLDKFGLVSFFSRIFFTNLDLCNRLDKFVLRRHRVDLILCPKQTHQELKDFPFITMNWDLGHKTTFAFPELIRKGSFETRQRWYQLEMQKALAIFAESETGKKELVHYLSIHPDKIGVVPLFPGNVSAIAVDETEQEVVLKSMGVKRHRFFYYPAQFWAHKNHYALVMAFKNLLEKDQCSDLKLVFTGSDKGNKDYIVSVIRDLGLTKSIIVKGYVSTEAVLSLYKNSLSLVMPSFIGPTNMPLLEAQLIGTPVICSDIEGHREICGDGALYVKADDHHALTEALYRLLDEPFRNSLIQRGLEVSRSSPFNVNNAVRQIEQNLIRLIPIRKAFR